MTPDVLMYSPITVSTKYIRETDETINLCFRCVNIYFQSRSLKNNTSQKVADALDNLVFVTCLNLRCARNQDCELSLSC